VWEKGFEVKPLPIDKAMDVIADWTPEKARDETAVRAICELLESWTVAVRIAGAYLASGSDTAAEYLADLEEDPLFMLDVGRGTEKHRRESIAVLLTKSLSSEQVSHVAQQCMSLLGHMAFVPFSLEPIAAGMALSETTVRKAINELYDVGMIDRTDDGYVVPHPYIHQYARIKMRVGEKRMMNLADYYIALLDASTNMEGLGFDKLAGERPHIIQLLTSCTESGYGEKAWDMLMAVQKYLDIQGFWAERIQAENVVLEAMKLAGEKKREGQILGEMGSDYLRLGQVEKAIEYYEQALLISQEIGDRRGEGNHLGNLGIAYADLGQVDKAIEYTERALEIFEEIKSPNAEQARAFLKELRNED
jgi:tetratricopeptide (TPR) repeat protein